VTLSKAFLQGLTGYGLGSALGGAADAMNPQIAGAEQALAGVGEQAATAASDLALSEVGFKQAINQALRQVLKAPKHLVRLLNQSRWKP
jgi:hypothetical protein